MPDPKTPAWYSKPVSLTLPAGLGVVVVTLLLGAAGAGGVGAATRDADLAAVQERVDAAADELRAEQARDLDAAEKVHAARYDEILRRLDRIERQLDGGTRASGAAAP